MASGPLGVFFGDDRDDDDQGQELFTRPHSADELRRIAERLRLTQLYEHWFEPVVLVRQRGAALNTLKLWRDSMGYWRRLTKNLPLAVCDGNEKLLSDFSKSLRDCRYQRSKVPGAASFALKPFTVDRHISHVLFLLKRAQQKGLISVVPEIERKRVRAKTKPAFERMQILAVFEAAAEMQRPAGLSVATPDAWRGLLATALITGVRKATYFALEWSWFDEDEEGWWIDFPDHSVPKTDRGLRVAVPLWLKTFLFRWPRTSERVFASPWSLSHWDDCHVELQRLANLKRPLSFQAWRRTLGREMDRLGANFARRVSSAALDHRGGDGEITDEFYTGAAQRFRREYPPLFDVRPDDGQLRLF